MTTVYAALGIRLSARPWRVAASAQFSHKATMRSRKCNLRIRSAKKWVGRSGRSEVYPFSLLGRSVGEF